MSIEGFNGEEARERKGAAASIRFVELLTIVLIALRLLGVLLPIWIVGTLDIIVLVMLLIIVVAAG